MFVLNSGRFRRSGISTVGTRQTPSRGACSGGRVASPSAPESRSPRATSSGRPVVPCRGPRVAPLHARAPERTRSFQLPPGVVWYGVVSGPSPAVARSHREQVLLCVWAHGRTAVLTETIWCCRAPACRAPGTRAPENLAPGDGRGPRGGDASPGGGRRDGCSLAARRPRASCCAARLRSAARVSGTLPQRTCWLSRMRERSRGAVAPGDWGPGGFWGPGSTQRPPDAQTASWRLGLESPCEFTESHTWV